MNQHSVKQRSRKRRSFSRAIATVARGSMCCISALGECGHDRVSRLDIPCKKRNESYNVLDQRPAIQFPIPALKVWSNSKALMGHVLFKAPLLKSSNVDMFSMGSNPSNEMGGSFVGSLHKRIRPKRLGSTKAIWVSVPAVVPGEHRCRIN